MRACWIADATRRVGHLFPFNHLRLRMQSMVAGRVVRVIVRDGGAALASFELEWCDGEFRRVASEHAPAFAWVVDMRLLEDAAERPWAYLAHPSRLGLAWFDAGRRVGAARGSIADERFPTGMRPLTARRVPR